MPGVNARVLRWKWIRLASGKIYEGRQALVIQHEIDHLNGVLITDYQREAP